MDLMFGAVLIIIHVLSNIIIWFS